LEKEREKRFLSGKKIQSLDNNVWIELKGLKGKEENGVFIQVSFERPGQNETIISQMIQTPYNISNFEQATLCLGPKSH
jgi:hypothetical protein